MENLHYYQREAIEKIAKFYNSGIQNAKAIISNGLGRTKIIINSVGKILNENKNCKILLISTYESTVKQYLVELASCSQPINVVSFLPDIKNNGIFVDTYKNLLITAESFDYNQFNLIILDDLDVLSDNYIYPFFEKSYKGKRLSLISSDEKKKLVKNDKLLFTYNISDAIKDGYFTPKKEQDFTGDFFSSLLFNIGFNNIELERRYKNHNIDIEANYNNKNYIFEIKTYRSKHVSSTLIENAAYIFKGIANGLDKKDSIPILVVASIVDKEIKEKIFNETEVEVWDVSNLLYLCTSSTMLLQKLSSYISFPIANIKPEKTLFYNNEKTSIQELKYESKYQKFEALLNECKPGKEDDKKYENICTDIIKYLFETEFFQMSNQHKTGDNLFRMDMICSLKGTTEFWKFLMQFFNTKFVVFEYKNYTEKISQNLVFITSKYLYPSALRNVAFIISRKGLENNAETVVNSKIKNEKMLIVDLTDKDLLVMVALKDEGKEPSDYLLEKVENLLMSLSI